MRRKSDSMIFFDSNDRGLPKVVRAFRDKYRAINKVLQANRDILDLAHKDFKGLSVGKRGRSGDFTSETILRTLIIHLLEGKSLRETIVMIGESLFLQSFTLADQKEVMDHTFLDRSLKVLRPETVDAIQKRLSKWAVGEGLVDPDIVRVDTTVVESNIHWPTDSSLLWDTYRVIERLMRRARKTAPGSIPWRFHPKKVKGLNFNITRYSSNRSKGAKRRVKKWMRILIQRVEGAIEKAEIFCRENRGSLDFGIKAIVKELKGYLPVMKQALDVAKRRFWGEKVPAKEKVFSLFEPHTELVMRGKRDKPVEFGHKLLLSQTKEKFILDFDLMEVQKSDTVLAEEVLARHRKAYGVNPEVLAADKGFCPKDNEYRKLAKQVETLAIPRRMRDFADMVLKGWQFFRAGIEGTISGLKRAFRMSRCMYRGFNTFKTAVGMGIVCHNLLLLGRLL